MIHDRCANEGSSEHCPALSHCLAGHDRLSILEAWGANNRCRAFENQFEAAILCACKLDIGARIRAVKPNSSTNRGSFWRHSEAAPEAKVDRASL
jgi:hypothetical protein